MAHESDLYSRDNVLYESLQVEGGLTGQESSKPSQPESNVWVEGMVSNSCFSHPLQITQVGFDPRFWTQQQ